jgi:transposase-like protein
VPTNILHSWKDKYGDEIGIRHVRATETPEHAELRELRKKVKELEEEKTILKEAAAKSTCQRNTRFSSKAGVSKPSVFRGRAFSSRETRSKAAWEC